MYKVFFKYVKSNLSKLFIVFLFSALSYIQEWFVTHFGHVSIYKDTKLVFILNLVLKGFGITDELVCLFY